MPLHPLVRVCLLCSEERYKDVQLENIYYCFKLVQYFVWNKNLSSAQLFLVLFNICTYLLLFTMTTFFEFFKALFLLLLYPMFFSIKYTLL